MQLIVIKPNDFQFQKEIHYKNHQKLKNDLLEHVELQETTFDNMMDLIVTQIGLTPELIGDSQTCYETNQNIYQVCFVGYDTNSCKDKELNKIATYLNGDSVYGTAVLINSKIGDTYTCLPDSVNMDELTDIVYSKFVHKGIFIPMDEKKEIVEYEYFNHPLEYFETTENNYFKYKLIETTFIGFHLGFFYEVNSDTINKRATRMIGTQKIFGNVVLLNKLPHEFQDIDKSLFKKLSDLSYGVLDQRELTTSENRENEKVNNLPVVMNRYCILNNRYSNYKNICDGCKKELSSTKLKCMGCFRTRYHDQECQKNHWNQHSNDCLYISFHN
ncbi:hypothetical protein Indivirus_3_28 [Indivirus ILV1]|uniref:MYND-type domain-containing protein n=1 Tax=Indivirus ILV1 TaxID=1977633 RepID=A0A1V0SDI2_9VIRU|nr:hypothetical protein Indivirus_3_28 [Indivirus ILV1]